MFKLRDSSDAPFLAGMGPYPAAAAAVRRRDFLIVTAPFGRFSSELAKALRREGAICNRILLNGGDISEWGLANATLYRGSLAGWPAWIARHLAEEGVTDLITHGDSHAYGASAIEAARALGLNVHVFEQGYFRPHWVTLEADGVNARSRLPRTAEAYRRVTPAPESPPVPVGRITPSAVRHIVRYHLWSYLGWSLSPAYRNPYAYPAFRQAFGHVRRYAVQRLRRRGRVLSLQKVFDGSPVFLALLQRPGDSQLTRHSPFTRPAEFIQHVVASFAAHSEPGARLLFKSHPLDHGLEPHARVIRAAARAAGVADRVFFADDGHLPTLMRQVRAVLSVNSTGGLSSLEAGLPTIVLGDAIYDMTGLTHQGGLASFWRAPEAPDRQLFDAYRATVMAACQINGAFSTDHGVALVVPEAVRRLLLSAPPQ